MTATNSNPSLAQFEPKEKDEPFAKEHKAKIRAVISNIQQKGIIHEDSLENYEILAKQHGGIGIVHKTVQNQVIRAIKTETIGHYHDEMQLWLHEIENLSEINHKNVIKLERIFFEEGHRHQTIVHLVFPWYENTLQSWLTADKRNYNNQFDQPVNGKFEELRLILNQILDGLQEIHAHGILHLNLKPQNILIDSSQNAVVAGFGCSQKIDKLEEQFCFTPGFAAPEIIEYMKKAACCDAENTCMTDLLKTLFTTKADIYAFGVILYKIFVDNNEILKEMITKQNIMKKLTILFPSECKQIDDNIIDDLEVVIKSCVEEDYYKRPQASNLLFEHKFFQL